MHIEAADKGTRKHAVMVARDAVEMQLGGSHFLAILPVRVKRRGPETAEQTAPPRCIRSPGYLMSHSGLRGRVR